MSASERLRALWRTVDEASERDFDGAMIDLAEACVDALPLIADVVEAAEAITGNGWIKGEDDGDPTALAVGAALTALREHLEGGGA